MLPLGEVELVVDLYPSSVRWIDCCLATGLPLGCEVVFERGVRYSLVVKILLGGGSLGGSPRWTR